MTVATTSPAGQAVAANAHARRLAEAEEARRHAREELASNRADTTTPLAAPAEQPAPVRAFRFSHDIRFKGRVITVYADGMTLSEFSALLDAHGFALADGATE